MYSDTVRNDKVPAPTFGTLFDGEPFSPSGTQELWHITSHLEGRVNGQAKHMAGWREDNPHATQYKGL